MLPNLHIEKYNNVAIKDNQVYQKQRYRSGTMKTITTRITVLPENQPIFSELATEIGIVDEAAGPYIEMRQIAQSGDEDILRFDIDEWPYIAKAVGKMIQEIKKLKP